jgi:hypothetical protein
LETAAARRAGATGFFTGASLAGNFDFRMRGKQAQQFLACDPLVVDDQRSHATDGIRRLP